MMRLGNGGLIDPDDPRVVAGMDDALAALRRRDSAGRVYVQKATAPHFVRVTLLLMLAAAAAGALIGVAGALAYLYWSVK